MDSIAEKSSVKMESLLRIVLALKGFLFRAEYVLTIQVGN